MVIDKRHLHYCCAMIYHWYILIIYMCSQLGDLLEVWNMNWMNESPHHLLVVHDCTSTSFSLSKNIQYTLDCVVLLYHRRTVFHCIEFCQYAISDLPLTKTWNQSQRICFSYHWWNLQNFISSRNGKLVALQVVLLYLLLEENQKQLRHCNMKHIHEKLHRQVPNFWPTFMSSFIWKKPQQIFKYNRVSNFVKSFLVGFLFVFVLIIYLFIIWRTVLFVQNTQHESLVCRVRSHVPNWGCNAFSPSYSPK